MGSDHGRQVLLYAEWACHKPSPDQYEPIEAGLEADCTNK